MENHAFPSNAGSHCSREHRAHSPRHVGDANTRCSCVRAECACCRLQMRFVTLNCSEPLSGCSLVAWSYAGIGLLSLFVFICSFIPIAGVFISTIPVAFVALTEYGFMKVIPCWRRSCYSFPVGVPAVLLLSCLSVI